MTRPRILLVYGTRYGQTAKIASRLAAMLDELGYQADLWNAAEVASDFALEEADGVIVGGSVIFGRHQRAVERFVHRHREALNRLPSAFLSVSGAAASAEPAAAMNARRQLERFLARTGWHPRLSRCVAGAIAYSEYSPVVRWLIRSIQRRTGGPTDTGRDHEFTDWNALRAFAEEFVAAVQPAPTAEGVPAPA